MSKYLVRMRDYHIFDLDESNNCYRSYSTKNVTYSDGTRPRAPKHFTFENLTENYDCISIEEYEIDMYEHLHNEHMSYMKWRTRSDGHGGVKEGTKQEYQKQLSYAK